MKDSFISLKSKQFFAFNIWSFETAKAVIDGCAQVGRDALLQTSMKAYDYIDKKGLRKYVSAYGVEKGIGVYLHLDHCKDIAMISDAIKNGWDSVMIDGSALNLAENIEITKRAVEVAHDAGVLIEAEIGQITGQSGVADYQDVLCFMKAVNVDMLAVAIGTAHGLYQGEINLDYKLLGQVNTVTDVPLVIHGGSGLSNEMFQKLLSFDMVKKINISTDIKQAYRKAIEKCYLNGRCEEKGFDPLILENEIQSLIVETVLEKEKLLERV